LPDLSEFPHLSQAQWEDWFETAAGLVLRGCPSDGVCLFYQTDRKGPNGWVDKAYLCQKAARALDLRLLWHKIVCRVPPNNPTFGRPGYSHLLCFSAGLELDLSRSYADVLVQAGRASWTRGIGLEVCHWICRFLTRQTRVHTLIAPFCGQGLALAVANTYGLNAIGIELSPKRARQARQQGPDPRQGTAPKID